MIYGVKCLDKSRKIPTECCLLTNVVFIFVIRYIIAIWVLRYRNGLAEGYTVQLDYKIGGMALDTKNA